MAELAINQYGEAFAPPTEAAHWLVRRMNDNKHGGPMPTFGKEGRPITLPLTATLADFQAALRAHNCAAGRYRLDPLDTAGRLMKGAPVAYLPYPPDRQPPMGAGDAADLPRNGNQPAGMAWGGPAPVPPLAWSTGGAFPLPAPNHLTGAEYLLGEAIRAQTTMLTLLGAQQAALLAAAADLVRAADGAKLPARKPAAATAPQVIVQQVPVPVYEDPEDDERAEADPPPPPPPPPGWHRKVGEAIEEFLPVAKMMINHKMADFMAGGAEAPTVAPRNAAEVAPEPEPEPEPEPAAPPVDVTPAAWSHLGAVVRMLGPAWKARVDAQLARMTPDERRAFVCSLVSLTRPEACEYVVGQVSIAEVRQARAASTAGAAPTAPAPTAAAPTAPTAPAAPAVPPTAPAAPTAAPAPTTAPVEAPIMTALPDTTDGPHAPTEAELPRLTPPSGPAAQATIRGIVNEVMGGHAAPTAATAPTAAGPGALAGLVDTLASEPSVIAPYLRRIPGGGAGVEALAATFLGAEGLAQINAELDAVPVPPVLQLMQARATAPIKPSAPTAPVKPPAPAASPLADPAVMARMLAVMPHLSAAEQATAQLLATRMPPVERNKLLGHLMAGSVADAVAFVRDAVTKYEAHGRPFG